MMFVTNCKNMNLDRNIKLKTTHLQKVDETSARHFVVVNQ